MGFFWRSFLVCKSGLLRFNACISGCSGVHTELLPEANAADAMNRALICLYKSGFWLERAKAEYVSSQLWAFLSYYSTCADLALRQKLRRFAMVPKAHMMAHAARELDEQCGKSSWSVNCLAFSNQIQEDFIGRPSRLSRRVNPRSVHRSVMFRAQIEYHQALSKADSDPRGMDAYRHE